MESTSEKSEKHLISVSKSVIPIKGKKILAGRIKSKIGSKVKFGAFKYIRRLFPKSKKTSSKIDTQENEFNKSEEALTWTGSEFNREGMQSNTNLHTMQYRL